MNIIKKCTSLFIGLIVFGGFNAVNASESAREAFKSRLENSIKLLSLKYGHYVPALPTMPSKKVITEILTKGKDFFSLRQPLSSLAPRTASMATVYFMLTYFQDLCDQVPSLKRFKHILKNVFVRIALAATGAFTAEQMSSKQIKYVMGALATFYLVVRYFGLKPALKRLKDERQDFESAFNHINFTNNANVEKIKERDEQIKDLTQKIRQAIRDLKTKNDELVTANDEIKVLNVKIAELERENIALSTTDINSLNHDLNVKLTLLEAEKISLENKIQALEEEKEFLDQALSLLSVETDVQNVLTDIVVEESEENDFMTPINTPVGSPNTSPQSSDDSDEDAISDSSSRENYQDALSDDQQTQDVSDLQQDLLVTHTHSNSIARSINS